MQRDSESTEHYSRLDEHWRPAVEEMRKIFKLENWKNLVIVLQSGAYWMFIWLVTESYIWQCSIIFE